MFVLQIKLEDLIMLIKGHGGCQEFLPIPAVNSILIR